MDNEIIDRVAEELGDLLAGVNHVVSIDLVAVTDRTGETPEALAALLYRAGGIALHVAAARRVDEPWRERLHALVAGLIPTTESWSVQQPARIELSADEIIRVTTLTNDLADAIETRLGLISYAWQMSSHGGDYREVADDVLFSYDIVWHDLLLVGDARAGLLHTGLSD